MIIEIPFEPGFRRTTGPTTEVRLPISVGYARGANAFVGTMAGCVAALLATAVVLAAIRTPSVCATYWDLAIVLLALTTFAALAAWLLILTVARLGFALTNKPALHLFEDRIVIERFRDSIMVSDVIAADLHNGFLTLSVKATPRPKDPTLIGRLVDFCLEAQAYSQSRQKLGASEVRVSYGELELGPWAVKHAILALAKGREENAELDVIRATKTLW